MGAGFGGGLAAGISATADAFRLLGGAAQVAGRVIGFVGDQIRQGFATNVELERATVALQRYTGSAEEAAAIVADLRREAAVSPFDDREIISAGRALIASAGGTRQGLLELIRVAERLAVLDPFQGMEGGVLALQEALSGDFTSLVRRFEIPLALIQRLKEQGVPNLEIVKQALDFRGVDTGAIEAFGRTFEGQESTIRSFAAELRGLVTSGGFQAVGQAYGHLVALIERYGDQLRVAAQAAGQFFAALGSRIVSGLAPALRLLDAVLPGVGSAILEEFARPIEAAGHAAEQTKNQLQGLQEQTDLQRVTRQLADVGVAAAQLQIDAERLRRGYEDQLRPLERQRELLQDNAELQRVQNALATNRATTERLRTEREITALQRAARGAEDPNAPGLTDRQRAIALALQERRLRLEELGLTEQQRPALQTVDRQIAAIRREQADALAPLERQLALRREEADLLQITRTQLQQAVDDAQRAADAFGTAWGAAGGPPPATQAENKKSIGQQADELAKAWLDRFQQYVDANGGNAWIAISKSLTVWTLTTGVPAALEAGKLIGAGVWQGVLESLQTATGPPGSAAAADWLRSRLADWLGLRGPSPPPSRSTPGNFPGTVRIDLPLVSPAAVAAATPAPPAAPVTVNVGGVDVQVGPDTSRDALIDELTQTLGRQTATAVVDQLLASQAATDPGASPALQGAGRAG